MWWVISSAVAQDVVIPDDAATIVDALQIIGNGTGMGTITLPPGTHVESLVMVDPTLTDITIQGAGAHATRWMPDSGASENLFFGTGGQLVLRDMRIDGQNQPGKRGIYASGGSVVIEDSWVEDFLAPNDGTGGGAIFTDGALTLQGEVFFGANDSPVVGGHIYVSGGTLTVTPGTMFHTGISTAGGAIFADAGAVVDIDGALFSDNLADDGGAVALDGAITTIDTSAFSRNSAVNGGGAIKAFNGGSVAVTDSALYENSATAAGAIDAHDTDLYVTRSHLWSNGATWAGGIGCGSADAAAASSCVVVDSAFMNNTSLTGGAILAERPALDVSGSVFCDNSGEMASGAIGWIGSYAGSIRENFFFSNGADAGGAINVSGATGDLEDNTFIANDAWLSGSAVEFSGASTLTMQRNIIAMHADNSGNGASAVAWNGNQLGTAAFNGWFGNFSDFSGNGPGHGGTPELSDPQFSLTANGRCTPAIYEPAPGLWPGIGLTPGGIAMPDADDDGYPVSIDCDDTVQGDGHGRIWLDIDRDGLGGLAVAGDTACPQSSWLASSTDCDDYDPTVTIPQWWPDADGDGYGDASATPTGSCFAPPNTADNALDCNDSDSNLPAPFPLDADGDGYGDGTLTGLACAGPNLVGIDCDDTDSTVNPGATETCNGVDDDCVGGIDDGIPTSSWHADTDGDGFGDANVGVDSCAAPTGFVADATDCDDTAAEVNPAAPEITADGVDNDCANGDACWSDADGDGFGAEPVVDAPACDAPGLSGTSGDCNDADNLVSPAGIEVCNADDDDCNGLVDDGIPTTTWHADLDGDGYGDRDNTRVDCAQPEGWLENGTDCDDNDSGVFPGAAEIPVDGIDSDCDGTELCYTDDDGDSFGVAPLVTAMRCSEPGVADNDADCDDADAERRPNDPESCKDAAFFKANTGSCGCASNTPSTMWLGFLAVLMLRRRGR